MRLFDDEAVPGGLPDPALVPSLLTLADVMCTGHHAAVSAGVGEGSTVAVIGDGAVGLCGILAARRLGASRIVALSRHEPRQRQRQQQPGPGELPVGQGLDHGRPTRCQ